jgi:RimJ/RimL family protein N-acetyltransferase
MLIQVRPTQVDDLAFVLQAEHDPANAAFVEQWSHDRHVATLADADFAHRIVERRSDAQPIGYIILAGLKNVHQSLEFRRLVITDKGHGYGRAAVRFVKQLAFEQYRVHRLWLDVRANNQRAQQLYQSEGFVIEGTLRECVKVDDRFESLIIMSLLRSEYSVAGR